MKIAVLVLLVGSVVAYAAGSQDHPKPDLKLELSTTSEPICSGSKLPLKLKITNQSDHDVQIHKLDLWGTFDYQHSDVNGKTSRAGLTVEPDWTKVNLPENTIMLAPNETFSSTHESKFWSAKGKYKLALIYGGAVSNEIAFELTSCK